MEENGFLQYEVSNFARSVEHQSKHNLNYWNGGDYIGIGPGAASRIFKINPSTTSRLALKSISLPSKWMENILSLESSGIEEIEELNTQQIIQVNLFYVCCDIKGIATDGIA